MIAIFHLHYLGHRIKHGNPEAENTTQQILSVTRPCWSIEFIESFLFWVILVTYNIGIYICIYIYKVSYIHSFFIIFTCNVFLHYMLRYEKYFGKLTSRFPYSPIHQVMWYFWVFIVNPFSLLCNFFFSRKLCFLWSSCLLFIAESISLVTSGKPTVEFFLKITSPSWIILSISLDELIQLIDCWKADDEFPWNNFYFIVVKEFWYGKKY